MATTYRDHGIVLLTRPHRDNDRLYTVYTRDHGKVVLVASGSRKTQSKMAPHMSTFGVVDVLVAQGKRVDRLAGASLEIGYRRVTHDAGLSLWAQVFFLVMDALTRTHVADARLYDILHDFCRLLEDTRCADVQPLFFDAALFKMFDALGLGIELDVCVKCRRMFTERGNTLNIVRGGITCQRCDDPMGMRVSVSAIKTLRFFRTEKLGHALLLRLPDDVRQEVSFLFEVMIGTHVQGRFSALAFLKQVVR